MRAKITFNLQEQEGLMPHYHQTLLSDWIEGIKVKSEQWRHYKSYNFSSLRGRAISQQEGLAYLTNQVKLIISSPSEPFIHFVTEQILAQKTCKIAPLHLAPVNAHQEPMPELSDTVKYVCIAPLVPSFITLENEETGKEFIHPQEDLFSDLLYECTMTRMEASGLYSAETIKHFFKFQVVPDQHYLNKVKQQRKLFARIYPINYDGQQYETRTYIFPFTLHADKQVQTYVYTYGLGAFTQQGLGMLDTKNTITNSD